MKEVSVKCPYCGTRVSVLTNLTDNYYGNVLVNCCVEEGGCDDLFVVKLKKIITIDTVVYTLKEVRNG